MTLTSNNRLSQATIQKVSKIRTLGREHSLRKLTNINQKERHSSTQIKISQCTHKIRTSSRSQIDKFLPTDKNQRSSPKLSEGSKILEDIHREKTMLRVLITSMKMKLMKALLLLIKSVRMTQLKHIQLQRDKINQCTNLNNQWSNKIRNPGLDHSRICTSKSQLKRPQHHQ